MKSSEISVPAAPSESSAVFPPDSAIPIRQSAIPNPVPSTSGESGTAAPLDSAIPIPQSAIPTPQSFPRRPGETPRAFSAFTTYFQLGHARSTTTERYTAVLDLDRAETAEALWGEREDETV